MGIEDELRAEVARRALWLSDQGITITLQSSPRDLDKTSSWANLRGPFGEGEIIVWSSREAEEGWNSHDLGVTGDRHHDDLTETDLVAVLDRLSDFVRGGARA